MKAQWMVEFLLALCVLIVLAVCVPDGLERCLALVNSDQVLFEAQSDDSHQDAGSEIATAEIEARVIELVNQQRRAAGLPPLQPDPTLTEIARTRSQDMLARGYLDHLDPQTGELLFCQLLRARGMQGGGENLFLTDDSSGQVPEVAVTWWASSPTHYQNMVRAQYRRTGVGVAVRSWRVYITQIFL